MDDIIEQVQRYLDKAEAALDAGEIEKADGFKDLARLTSELAGPTGRRRAVGSNAGGETVDDGPRVAGRPPGGGRAPRTP